MAETKAEDGCRNGESHDVPDGALFCLGSSMVDLSAECDPSLLEKYNLKDNDCVLATESHLPLFDELAQLGDEVTLTPGGSALNTARVAQWILQKYGPKRVTFVSCIGTDKYGNYIEEQLEASGINAHLAKHPTEPTGVCAALVTNGDQRSLCTRLGASKLFTKDFLTTPEVLESLGKAKVFYSVAYFLTHSPDCVTEIADIAYKDGKTFVLNLSAPYVCECYLDELLACIPYADALVGNAAEALAFGRKLGLETEDLRTIVGTLSQLPNFKMKPRIIVITNGSKPVLVVNEVGRVREYPVEEVKNIKDTIAAGDAFVAGFLAKLAEGGSVEMAVKCGIRVAGMMVQQRGCTLPPESPDL